MSTYSAVVLWQRGDQPFSDGQYSRGHTWRFDGGIQVPGSASPSIVEPALSVAAAVDPEEAFVASLSGCHMLFFLDFPCRAGFRVDAYEDTAEGVLAPDAGGKLAMTTVTLRPRIVFSGEKRPSARQIDPCPCRYCRQS